MLWTLSLVPALLLNAPGAWAQQGAQNLPENPLVEEAAPPEGAAAPQDAETRAALERVRKGQGEIIKAEAQGRQIMELDEVAEDNEEWGRDPLTTGGLKFIIRGKEALAWTMGIEGDGLDNPAIESSYRTVLTIVNSLFILGLLGIAGMWMFSLFIPRHRLRKVILAYGIAVVFVNFAMPVNRLLVDGTNLLQKTLLTHEGNPIGIVDIVSTPLYSEAFGFHNRNLIYRDEEKQYMGFEVEPPDLREIPIGRIQGDPNAPQILDGNISLGAEGGRVVLTEQNGGASQITLNPNQEVRVSLTRETSFDPNQENRIFSFILMVLTGLAYLMISLIFLVRLVILWGLLILSPLLFLLAVFGATRGYFFNWMSLYGRWLFIGPLVALGLSVMVNIWQIVGLPITSSYTLDAAANTFGDFNNYRFYLPGSVTPNEMSTTGQMMEYILFLIMLYLPIFFGFALTRQKTWQAAAGAMEQGFGRIRNGRQNGAAGHPSPAGSTEKTEEKSRQSGSLIGGIKDFVGTQMGKITKVAMPGGAVNPNQKSAARPVPGAASFLPQQLTLSTIPDMMELLGAKESRNGHQQVIGRLADPARITDPAERKNISAVRTEIEKRASQGDPQASLVMSEIGRVAETQISVNVTSQAAPAAETAFPETLRVETAANAGTAGRTQDNGSLKNTSGAGKKTLADKEKNEEDSGETGEDEQAEEKNDGENTEKNGEDDTMESTEKTPEEAANPLKPE